MNWTKTAPDKDGVYWLIRANDEPVITEVEGGRNYLCGSEDSGPVTSYGPEALWYGPIEPPHERPASRWPGERSR